MNLYFDFLVDVDNVLTVEDNKGNALIEYCPAKAGFVEGTKLYQYSEATISFPEFEIYKIYGKTFRIRNKNKSRNVSDPRYGKENQNNYGRLTSVDLILVDLIWVDTEVDMMDILEVVELMKIGKIKEEVDILKLIKIMEMFYLEQADQIMLISIILMVLMVIIITE